MLVKEVPYTYEVTGVDQRIAEHAVLDLYSHSFPKSTSPAPISYQLPNDHLDVPQASQTQHAQNTTYSFFPNSSFFQMFPVSVEVITILSHPPGSQP